MGFWIAASADWSSALAAILRFTTHSSVSVMVIPRFSFRRNLQAWCFWRIPGLQQSLAHKNCGRRFARLGAGETPALRTALCHYT
jgi:hypothetical protein